MAAIRLIVGLGNPGAQYLATRHNVGAWFIDLLARAEGLPLKPERKFFGQAGRLTTFSEPCWLLFPTTFMNDSGKAVAALANFYKIPPESILVAHDELDFPVGDVKLKVGGGHGGHNGLRDIINHLGTKDFMRLRIGIDHPGHRDRVTPYVLGVPSKGDQTKILTSIEDATGCVADLINGDIEAAFRYLHC